MNKTIGYALLLVLLAATCVFSVNLFFRERTSHDVVDIRKFSYVIGEWKGKDLEITEEEYKILETRNLILREYTNPRNEKIALFIVYSETNRSVFHPPEVCMIGSGLDIVEKDVEKIDYAGRVISTNKMRTEKGEYKALALYCYKAQNLYTDSYYLQQVYFAFNQIFHNQVKGATIRVTMPIIGKEEATLAALKKFLIETAKVVDSM
jgi:EpsI family protein